MFFSGKMAQLAEIADMVLTKLAAVDAAALAGGGMGGGMDPAAMGAAGGGGMPPDPAAMGAPPAGGGGVTREEVMAIAQQAAQQAMAGAGGAGGAGAAGGIKPKIDVNVELMQIKKLLARMADAQGVHIPAQEMVATPGDLTQMAAQQNQPQAGAGGGAAAGGSAIAPPAPIQPASPALAGQSKAAEELSGRLQQQRDRAAALEALLSHSGKAA